MALCPTKNSVRRMPDVVTDSEPRLASTLDWVGMGSIDVPVLIPGPDGAPVRTPARVDAYVDLVRPEQRGIHMSRLYLQLDHIFSAEPLTPCSLRRLLNDFLESQQGASTRAMVRIRFDYLARRRALASEHSGWKAYPVVITGLIEQGRLNLELAFSLAYSSTCPCSAALARQLVRERFQHDFAVSEPLDRAAVLAWLGSEHGSVAIPHSQRSTAQVRARLSPTLTDFPILMLIDRIEEALKTAVQTAVKREDEQAFAQLNARNLMFCEDAARRMHAALDAEPRVVDFWVRAVHHESLHPHDAVAVASKGVEGGYRAGIEDIAPL